MLTHDLPLQPQFLSIQPPKQIKSNTVTSTHLTVGSLSAHFTLVLTVRGVAIRQPVDVWHLTLCVMVESGFHSALVTAVGGQSPHSIGSRSRQRRFCGVAEKRMEKKNGGDSPTAIYVRE